jgi:hypothetical protein
MGVAGPGTGKYNDLFLAVKLPVLAAPGSFCCGWAHHRSVPSPDAPAGSCLPLAAERTPKLPFHLTSEWARSSADRALGPDANLNLLHNLLHLAD